MFLYRGSSRGMGGSPEDLGLLAVAGPQTYCGTLGQPAVCSCCQSPHGFPSGKSDSNLADCAVGRRPDSYNPWWK